MKFLTTMIVVFSFATQSFAATNIKKISQVPMKHFFLSYEDLQALSEKDRSIYLIALSNMLTVQEIAQDHFVGKIDEGGRKPADEGGAESNEQDDTSKLDSDSAKVPIAGAFLKKASLVFSQFLDQANAVLPALGIVAGAVGSTAARFLGWRAISGAVARSYTATAGWAGRALTWTKDAALNLPGIRNVGSVMASRSAAAEVAAAEKLAVKVGISKEAALEVMGMQALVGQIRVASKAVEVASVADKAAKTAELAKVMKIFEKQAKALTGSPEQKAELIAALEKLPGWKKFLQNNKQFLYGGATVGSVVYQNEILSLAKDGGDAAIDLLSGIGGYIGQGVDFAKAKIHQTAAPDSKTVAAPKPISELGSNAEIAAVPAAVAAGVGAAPLDPEGKPLQTTFVPTVDKGCIFGLRSSVWVDYGGKPYCTRPASSKNSKCASDQYPCPNFGLVADGVADEILFCVPLKELKDLSVRCNLNMQTQMKERQLKISKEQYEKFIQQVSFKGDKGEISLAAYCEGASKVQTSECSALQEIEKLFETAAKAQILAKADAEPVAAPPVATEPAKAVGTDSTDRAGK